MISLALPIKQWYHTHTHVVQVQTVAPYNVSMQGTVTMLSEDPWYSSDSSSDAVRQILSYTEVVPGNASAGLIASVDVLVNTSASYANIESDNQTDSESWPHEHVAATVIIIVVSILVAFVILLVCLICVCRCCRR